MGQARCDIGSRHGLIGVGTGPESPRGHSENSVPRSRQVLCEAGAGPHGEPSPGPGASLIPSGPGDAVRQDNPRGQAVEDGAVSEEGNKTSHLGETILATESCSKSSGRFPDYWDHRKHKTRGSLRPGVPGASRMPVASPEAACSSVTFHREHFAVLSPWGSAARP